MIPLKGLEQQRCGAFHWDKQCDLLSLAVFVFFLSLAMVLPLIITGRFGRTYRERIAASLSGGYGAGDSELLPLPVGARSRRRSCWKHCLPLSHQLALCQEARAVSADYNPAQVNRQRVTVLTVCAVLLVGGLAVANPSGLSSVWFWRL